MKYQYYICSFALIIPWTDHPQGVYPYNNRVGCQGYFSLSQSPGDWWASKILWLPSASSRPEQLWEAAAKVEARKGVHPLYTFASQGRKT